MSSALDPLELYAGAIDASDYVARVAPLVMARLGAVGTLLDVGAGGGQLGAALTDSAPWSAIEPSPTMRRRLERLPTPPRIVATGWESAEIADGSHDTVLAATMPAFFDHPGRFLDRCRQWAHRTVVWVVPAHAGPRGLCFAGCLPKAWHREDETPGIDIVLRGLPRHDHPATIDETSWTFTGIVPDIDRLAAYLADRLDWPASDSRRDDLAAHLKGQAKPHADGFRLGIPRKSAIFVWSQR